jgi:hypothetical protein
MPSHGDAYIRPSAPYRLDYPIAIYLPQTELNKCLFCGRAVIAPWRNLWFPSAGAVF